MFMIYLFTSNLLNEEQKERTDHKDQSFSMLYVFIYVCGYSILR